MRTVIVAALLFAQAASAQAVRNAVEKAHDRQELRQDARSTNDDRLDAARAKALLAQYDQAAALNQPAQMAALDDAFNRHISREIVESQVESAQDRQEVRRDKRELRSDRREVRRDLATGKRAGVVADDVHDKNKDRRNAADDRVDALKEHISRERLTAIQGQLAGLQGRFDGPSVQAKRALYAEVVAAAAVELHRDAQETREDKRELREDRKETREDRRQR